MFREVENECEKHWRLNKIQILAGGKGEQFIEHVPQQLESFSCGEYVFNVFLFCYPFPGVSNSKTTHSGPWTLLTQFPSLLDMRAMLVL